MERIGATREMMTGLACNLVREGRMCDEFKVSNGGEITGIEGECEVETGDASSLTWFLSGANRISDAVNGARDASKRCGNERDIRSG
jgi:hypothetical protein